MPRALRQKDAPASQPGEESSTLSTVKVISPASIRSSIQARASSRIWSISAVSDASLSTTKSKARIRSLRWMDVSCASRLKTGSSVSRRASSAGIVVGRRSRSTAKAGSASRRSPFASFRPRTATM